MATKDTNPGISNRESAEEEQRERERLRPVPHASEPQDAEGGRSAATPGGSENEQTSSKGGTRSGAQKGAESKYVTRPHPASEKVEGAFGRESGE